MALGNNDNIIIQNNVNLDAELRAELDREKAKVKELIGIYNSGAKLRQKLNTLTKQLRS